MLSRSSSVLWVLALVVSVRLICEACKDCLYPLRSSVAPSAEAVLCSLSVSLWSSCSKIVIFRENRHQRVIRSQTCNLSPQRGNPLRTAKTCVSVSQSLIKYGFTLFCLLAYAVNMENSPYFGNFSKKRFCISNICPIFALGNGVLSLIVCDIQAIL